MNSEPEPKQTTLSTAVTSTHRTIKAGIDRLKSERYIILALYFAVSVAFFVPAALIGGTAGAILLGTSIILTTILTVYLLHIKQKTDMIVTGKRIPWKDRLSGAIVVSFVIIIGIVAHKLKMLATITPGIYPIKAAEKTLENHFARLNDVFQSNNDMELMQSYNAYLETLASETRNRFIKRDLRAAGINIDNKTDKEQYKLQAAKTFREAYGGISQVSSESILFQKAEGNDRQYFFALTKYIGRFLIDASLEDILVDDFVDAASNPNSVSRKRIENRIIKYFPYADFNIFWKEIRKRKLSQLLGKNALEVLGYLTGSLGKMEEARLLYGKEVVLYSIALSRKESSGGFFNNIFKSNWNVVEIGKWGIWRQPLGSIQYVVETINEWVRLPVDFYVRQRDESLCQSACLEILARLLKPSKKYDQYEIRKELENTPKGALSHESRLEWVKNKFSDYNWKLRYEKDMSNTFRDMQKQIDCGIPIVLTTRLTKSGHVVVITGIGRDNKGNIEVEVMDPYGSFDFISGKHNQSIKSTCIYPLDKLSVKTRKYIKGNKEKYSMYCVGYDKWIPDHEEMIAGGYVPAGDIAQDWEWLEGTIN